MTDQAAPVAMLCGRQVRVRIGNELLIRSLRYAVERKSRERERLRLELDHCLFAEAVRVLAISLDPPERARAILDLIVPKLADWAIIDFVGDDGRFDTVAINAFDGDTEDRLPSTTPSSSPLHVRPRLGPRGHRKSCGRGKSSWPR